MGKIRTKLSDKTTWDGKCSTFRPYSEAIEGHLLQTGAGYMANKTFLKTYKEYMDKGENFLISGTFEEDYGISYSQAVLDKTWLYGMLKSSNREGGERKILLRHSDSQDGLLAWIDFKKDYGNNGSDEIRVEILEEKIATKYSRHYTGGFISYLDDFQATMSELEILLPSDYSDARRRRLLLQNVGNARGISHLVQYCKDFELSFDQSIRYLRENSMIIHHRNQVSEKQVHKVEATSSHQLNMEETRQLFHTMAEEAGYINAFHVLNSSSNLRESLSIPPKIWTALSESLKAEIANI